jgi:nitrate reductase NapA
MELSRRQFLKMTAMASVVLAAGCSQAEPTPAPIPEATATPMPEVDLTEVVRWQKTVCRFCGTGCGVKVGVNAANQLIALKGDDEHPTTKGLVCAKALFLPKIIYSSDRLQTPMIRKNGKLEEVSWDEAMDLVASKFADAIKQYGPNSVAYYGSGQAFSEESYFANRLFKGGIGTNNVEGNPRLCMASAVGGYVTTFGKDEPMGSYDDIDHAKVFFLTGTNTAEAHPVIFDRILARKEEDPDVKIILLDPRNTAVRKVADIHMAPVPGFDLAIYHAMAHVIIREGLHDRDFVDKHTVIKKPTEDGAEVVSFDDYVAFLEDFTPEAAAAACDVKARDIEKAALLFAEGPSMSFWTMGLNQRSRGVWANNLVHNLHLLTGHIGKPGATSFSITGQPNACGGVRDTGSLAHLLPYGRVVKKPEHREFFEKFWGVEPGRIQDKPGKHTIAMFDALASGDIKVMMTLCTNPGQSLPNLTPYREAMGSDESFLVVLDAYPTRTTELADVVLPAAMWSEKRGTYGMSERRYQLLEKIVDGPPGAIPDLDILMDLAKRLQDLGVVPAGYTDGLETVDDVWAEMMAASADTPYDFRGMTRARMEKERGLRWPCPTEDHPGTGRRYVKGEDPILDSGPYADNSLKKGDIKFYAGVDGSKAIIWLRPALGPAEPADDEYPVVLSTGRVIEHWHTMTMTGKAPELLRAQPEAFVEINPRDAKEWGIEQGDMVKITSRRGQVTVKAKVIATPRRGMVFVPWHWPDDDSLINRVTINAFDPGSKQPEFKVCAVQVTKA